MLQISWSTETTFLDPDTGNLIGEQVQHVLEFDVETRVSHKGASELTTDAVDTGEPVASHKRALPPTVSIEAIVTQTPIGNPPPSGYQSGAAPVANPTASNGATVMIYSAEFDRIRDVENTLSRLRLEATPVTITTRVRTYENMQIVVADITEDVETGDAILIQIDTQAVRVAVTRETDIPAAREPRGGAEADRGAQEGTDETDRRSTLSRIEEDYQARRASGESASDAALGSLGGILG
jgi:hypothetical protein